MTVLSSDHTFAYLAQDEMLLAAEKTIKQGHYRRFFVDFKPCALQASHRTMFLVFLLELLELLVETVGPFARRSSVDIRSSASCCRFSSSVPGRTQRVSLELGLHRGLASLYQRLFLALRRVH